MSFSHVFDPLCVYLYDGGWTHALDLFEIIDYLKARIKGIRVESRIEFVSYHLSSLSADKREDAIKRFALILARNKIQNIMDRDTENDPLPGEIEYEKRWLGNSRPKPFGILYNGFSVHAAYSQLIPKNEMMPNHIHLAFTNQLLGSWDEDDLRYHARVNIYGFPSFISTTGLVEAPAKPREFYLKKNMGLNLVALKKEFAGRFIDYDDQRITEVIKGYVMQALFYHLTGKPFCDDRNCRLYNGHWQEEVIHAQLEGDYEFCTKHKEFLTNLRKI